MNRKGENVNVWIQSFDDVKVESNKVASNIYTGSATSCVYVQSSSNSFEIFHYLYKSFKNFEHTLGSSPLCSRFSKRQPVSWLQSSQSKRQLVSWLQLIFWDEQKDFSPLE